MALSIRKTNSFLVAEAVLAIFVTLDDQTEKEIDISVRATTVGQQSAILLVDEMAGRVAWVLEHRVSDNIRLLFGTRADKSYDFDRIPTPNDLTREWDFDFNQHYDAAKALYAFFTSGA